MEQLLFEGGDARSENYTGCKVVVHWIVQCIVWFAIAVLMWDFHNIIEDDDYLTSFSICYFLCIVIYGIVETYCSQTFHFLLNKHQTSNVSQYMKSIYTTNPKVVFSIENYHEETYYEDGRLKTRKVITNNEKEEYNFLSSRDLSNDLILDAYSVKIYIKLFINLKLTPADNQSNFDFENAKEGFINKWKHYDLQYNFNQWSTLQGLSRYNLIKIKDEEPLLIGIIPYLICVFLIPIAELYKLYFNSLCYEQDYTVKKEVSTHSSITGDVSPAAIPNNYNETSSLTTGANSISDAGIRLPEIEIRGETELQEDVRNKESIKSKKN